MRALEMPHEAFIRNMPEDDVAIDEESGRSAISKRKGGIFSMG